MAEIFQGYRNSIGDINMPSFETWENKPFHLVMVVWILFIFFLSSYLQIIVMLNFLIAKISAAYEEVMTLELYYLVLN